MSSMMVAGESAAPSQVSEPISRTKQTYNRLSFPDFQRVSYASLAAVCAGALLGAGHGSRMEALRFRAENAHRLPTTTKGWYLYHKSKNYAVMWTGLREGAKLGGKLGFWVGFFFCTELLIDRWWNEKRDFRSTLATGTLTTLAWSRFFALSRQATSRLVMTGFKVGLGYGLLQDGVALLNKQFKQHSGGLESTDTVVPKG